MSAWSSGALLELQDLRVYFPITSGLVLDRHVVTGELTVRYERPVPVEQGLVLCARVLDRSHARYAQIEGEVTDGHIVLARSMGKFFYVERTAPSAP